MRKGLNRHYIDPIRKRKFIPLGKVNIENINQTLVFSEIIARVPVHISNITQTLTFTGTLSREVIYTPDITDNIIFNDIVNYLNTHLRTISQTLVFSQSLSYTSIRTISKNVSQTLVFNQSVGLEVWLDSIVTETENCIHIKPVSVNQFIFFQDCADFEHTHQNRRFYLNLADTINFNNIATGTIGQHYHKTINQTLTFSERINKSSRINELLTFIENIELSIGVSFNRTINQTLTFTQLVSETKKHLLPRSISQTLVFSESKSSVRVRVIHKIVPQSIVFTDNISLNKIQNFSLSQNLKFTDAFIKKANSIEDVLLPVAYATKVQKLLVLVGNGVITLPSPEWGDTETLKDAMNLRRSMNGRTYTYVRTNNRKHLKYTFKLSRRKSLELRQFVKRNYDRSILIANYLESEVWISKISELPIEFNFENSSRTESGRLSVDLQLEGVRIQ